MVTMSASVVPFDEGKSSEDDAPKAPRGSERLASMGSARKIVGKATALVAQNLAVVAQDAARAKDLARETFRFMRTDAHPLFGLQDWSLSRSVRDVCPSPPLQPTPI